jgi:hypothetical protein
MNDEFDEQWTLHSIMEYMSENFIGIILLILAFFIIYFVDHINQLNAIIFAPQTSIPQLPNIPQIANTMVSMKVKSKKLKKR